MANPWTRLTRIFVPQGKRRAAGKPPEPHMALREGRLQRAELRRECDKLIEENQQLRERNQDLYERLEIALAANEKNRLLTRYGISSRPWDLPKHDAETVRLPVVTAEQLRESKTKKPRVPPSWAQSDSQFPTETDELTPGMKLIG